MSNFPNFSPSLSHTHFVKLLNYHFTVVNEASRVDSIFHSDRTQEEKVKKPRLTRTGEDLKAGGRASHAAVYGNLIKFEPT